MGINGGGIGVGSGLDPIDYMALIPGQTLLFARGKDRNLIAAEVTVEQVLVDDLTCRVKVHKIVTQGPESKVAIDNILTATLTELTKP